MILDGYEEWVGIKTKRLKEVIIVTSGQYSDYQIEGVFTTREKAQAHIDKHVEPYYACSEMTVWELDPEEEE